MTAADQRPSNRWLFAVIAILLALSVAIQVVRDRGWEPYYPEDPTMWIRSGSLMSRLVLGYDALASDVYWMRAVIYYGTKHRAEGRRSYDLLHPLLELVTTLDPHFRRAYRFGAIFLAEAYPEGAARPDQAIALLERGIAQDGGRWEYYLDIGFVNYWWRHDYKSAAEWFARGAERPSAPEWLKPLAATTLAQGGDRQSSRFLWTELLRANDTDWLRQAAEHRLKQLDAMDAIDQVTMLLKRFRDREGAMPKTWQELVAAERLPGVPVDPAGVPFVVDTATGRVDVSNKSPLWPLPVEPAPGVPR
jgi:tetratricopeptide (TPR) repeat protein